MAVSVRSPRDLLRTHGARAAGALSLAVSLLAVAGVIAHVLTEQELAVQGAVGAIIWGGLFVLAAAAAVSLLRGKVWAQKTLLLFWLLVAGAALVVLIWAMLFLSAQVSWPSVLELSWRTVLLGILCVGVLNALLLVLATPDGSRSRYASLVTVSAVVATALVILVNLITHDQPVRQDLQTLGRYGLSPRSKQIVRAIDEDVRLTCLYTGTDDLTKTTYRPRTLDYLGELREQIRATGGRAELTNITTDAQKARLVARMAEQIRSGSQAHLNVLQEFVGLAETTAEQLRQQAERFAQMPPDSNLGWWGLPVEANDTLTKAAKQIEQTSGAVRTDTESTTELPNVQRLLRQSINAFDTTEDKLRTLLTRLRRIKQIPSTIEANSTETLDRLTAAVEAARETAGTLGQTGDPIPDKPSQLLGKFVAAADRASSQAIDAGRQLAQIAGRDNADLLAQNPLWQIRVELAPGIAGRTTLSRVVDMLGGELNEMRASAQALSQAAKEEHIREVLPQWRQEVSLFLEQLQKVTDRTREAVAKLTDIDPESKQVYDELSANTLFTETNRTMRDWLKKARSLPELESSSLATQLPQENVVLIEVGDEAEIVPFDEIWPLKMPQLSRPGRSEQAKRSFNGDSAISSRILKMTHEPFATVLLTYYKANVPPRLQRSIPPGLEPKHFETLQQRLREANFEVKEWNLRNPIPERTEEEGDRPRVLLILPPPPAVMGRLRQEAPSFGPEHVEKVRQAINSTTDPVTAVFLTHFSWPRQIAPQLPPMSPPYAYGEFLHENWDIDVLSDYWVIPFVPHATRPGEFRVDFDRLRWITLAGFTDHPISRPLQAQRTAWTDLCPVRRAQDQQPATDQSAEQITITPLLRVPVRQDNIWATNRIMELGVEFQQSEENTVRPNPDKGDVLPPFTIAVAAARSGDEEAQLPPSRITVLPVAASLLDGYLDREILVRAEDGGTKLTDPPRGNADLVVNSVYWLTGREQYIASGPVRVKPVEMIEPGTMKLLWGLCVVALPLAVLAIGGIVMLLRRT